MHLLVLTCCIHAPPPDQIYSRNRLACEDIAQGINENAQYTGPDFACVEQRLDEFEYVPPGWGPSDPPSAYVLTYTSSCASSNNPDICNKKLCEEGGNKLEMLLMYGQEYVTQPEVDPAFEFHRVDDQVLGAFIATQLKERSDAQDTAIAALTNQLTELSAVVAGLPPLLEECTAARRARAAATNANADDNTNVNADADDADDAGDVNNADTETSATSSSNGGLIAGIVVGILLGVGATVGAVFLLKRRTAPRSFAHRHLPATSENPMYNNAAAGATTTVPGVVYDTAATSATIAVPEPTSDC